MSGIFGGPKRDKQLEAMQARQRQEAERDRAELEEDKARVAGSGRTARRGRASLRSKRSAALKTKRGG